MYFFLNWHILNCNRSTNKHCSQTDHMTVNAYNFVQLNYMYFGKAIITGSIHDSISLFKALFPPVNNSYPSSSKWCRKCDLNKKISKPKKEKKIQSQNKAEKIRDQIFHPCLLHLHFNNALSKYSQTIICGPFQVKKKKNKAWKPQPSYEMPFDSTHVACMWCFLLQSRNHHNNQSCI